MLNVPKTRTEANAQSAKHYFTGKPCSKGHIAVRHITGTCAKCQQEANRRWEQRNPGEGSRRSLAWQKNNPERARLKSLKSKRKAMGIPKATRPLPAHCENCGTLLVKGRNVHLDHCHKTGKFRGWLCNRCNLGIGCLGDNIQGLRQAIEYLERVEYL